MAQISSTARPASLRGTQSLVQIIAATLKRPDLLAVELTWRWIFGIPALLVIFYEGKQLLVRAALPTNLSGSYSVADPNAAALVFAGVYKAIQPPLVHLLWWLAPVLAIGWAFCSGIGRSVLLRRMVPGSNPDPGTLIALQGLRVVLLAGSTLAWFLSIERAARSTLTPSMGDANFSPNLVGYFAWVIGLSLGMFSVWALVSWVSSIAPLIAVLEQRGVLSSFWRSLRLRRLTPKLVEVNFVMGIIKMALVVLTMVFCATPVPFESLSAGGPLYLYWGLVTVLYLVASDFFQIARLAAFIHFYQLLVPSAAA